MWSVTHRKVSFLLGSAPVCLNQNCAADRFRCFDCLLFTFRNDVAIFTPQLVSIDDGLPHVRVVGLHEPGTSLPERRLADDIAGHHLGKMPALWRRSAAHPRAEQPTD